MSQKNMEKPLQPHHVLDSQIIQLYGVEGSGTVYMQKLLTKNYQQLLVSSGSKHFGPVLPENPCFNDPGAISRMLQSFQRRDGFTINDPDRIVEIMSDKYDSGKLFFLIVTRNPYAVAQTWLKRDENVKLAVSNWNLKNRRYLQFFAYHRKRSSIVDLEKVIENPLSVLTALENQFGLIQSAKYFTNIPGHAHAENVANYGRPQFSCEYQLKQGYLRDLGADVIKTISTQLDPVICRLLGFNIL